MSVIRAPEITLERIAVAADADAGLADLARRAVADVGADGVGGVIAATFSNPDRFPSLAVRVCSWLHLPPETPAFDLQMACSAYPYAVYLAGRLAADTGRRVLVVDGDAQTPLVDGKDPATGAIFSDAATATVVSASPAAESAFGFLSAYDTALACPAAGPIRMDGFKVFSFVATEVSKFLREFGDDFDVFAPHQANPYMVRQLARSLGLADRLLTVDPARKNPGSCSVAMALAENWERARGRRALIAGFGAGYSASAGIVRIA